MTFSRMPDLDSLALLVLVAETGSLGRAAARHGISQPAVSARMAATERLLGVPLLVRGARGSTLTAAGALVVEWAGDVLAAAAALDSGAAVLRADTEERLRIAASLTVAEHLLPRWLVGLAAARPGVSMTVRAANSAAVQQQALAGEVDLGFVEGPDIASGLDRRVVGHDELVLVVPPRHPWARRRGGVSGAELAVTRLVQREQSSGTREALESALAEHAPTAKPLLELGSSIGIVSAVSEGAGPAVLSRLAVQSAVAMGTVRPVAVRGIDLRRTLHAVWRRGQRPTGPARDLLRVAAS